MSNGNRNTVITYPVTFSNLYTVNANINSGDCGISSKSNTQFKTRCTFGSSDYISWSDMWFVLIGAV